MKKAFFSLNFILLSFHSFSQSPDNCRERELFSPLPNHELIACESREYDDFTIYVKDSEGNRTPETKSGEKSIINYRWLGEWNARPSTALIYKNYQGAVEKIGGKLLYSGSGAYFYFEKSDKKYWMEVNSDGSGDYQVTYIREEKMNRYVTWTAKEIQKAMAEDGQISFYGILFDTDQVTIKTESEEILGQIANYLKSNPGIKVYLVGHTDNTGSAEHNLHLSKQRAEAVTQYLIQKHQVPDSQIKPEGVGELSPVASNLSEEGKAKNRRVVMVLRK